MRGETKMLTVVAIVAAVAAAVTAVAIVVVVVVAQAAVVVAGAVVNLALGPRSSAGCGARFSIVEKCVFFWGNGFCCIRHGTLGCLGSGTSRRRS